MIGRPYQCATCGAWVILAEPTQAQLDAALDAYRHAGRTMDEADHIEAMREALAAALVVDS